LRRHFEKYTSTLPKTTEGSDLQMASMVSNLTAKKGGHPDETEKTVAQALMHWVDTQAPTIIPSPDYTFTFGPFRYAQRPSFCARCNLMAPSAQTGPVCITTNWCWACSITPAMLYDDFLRTAHHIRAAGPKRVSLGGEESPTVSS
jgi:hypothetical protein